MIKKRLPHLLIPRRWIQFGKKTESQRRNASQNLKWIEALSDPQRPQTQRYIDRENQRARSYFQSPAFQAFKRPYQKQLEQIFYGPYASAVDPAPTQILDGWEYALRDGVYCRRSTAGTGDFQVYFNPMSVVSSSMDMEEQVHLVHVSPDHKTVGYLVKQEGQESGTLCFQSIQDSADASKSFHSRAKSIRCPMNQVVNFVWLGADHVLFTTADKNLRPHKVWRLEWRTGALHPLFHEENETFFVDVSTTKDRQLMTINCNSRSCSEVWLLPAQKLIQNKNTRPICFRPRQPGVEYYVDHIGDRFYIVSNAVVNRNNNEEQDPWKFRLYSCESVDQPWTCQLSTHLPSDCLLEDIDLLEDHVILYARQRGLPRLFLLHPSTQTLRPVAIPQRIGTLLPGLNQDPRRRWFRYQWQDANHREQVFECHVDTLEQRCLRYVPVVGPSASATTTASSMEIRVERLDIPSGYDETRIPLTVFAHHSLSSSHFQQLCDGLSRAPAHPLQGSNRCSVILSAYGCYGTPTEPTLDPVYLPLLKEQHMVYICAHVRGGGELGRQWAWMGRGLRKPNAIRDTISAAQRIRALESQETRVWLAGVGVSAGGMVMASAAMDPTPTHPSLFNTLILHVSFLDPLSAMMDPSHPLTTTEYEEWGDPRRDPEAARMLQMWSPYERIQVWKQFYQRQCEEYEGRMNEGSEGHGSPVHHGRWPDWYLTAGWLDQRVPFHHPLRFLARLRQELPHVYGVSPPSNGWRDRVRSLWSSDHSSPDSNHRPTTHLITHMNSGHFGSTSYATEQETTQWLVHLAQRAHDHHHAK